MSDVSTPRADYTYHLDEWKTVTDTFGGQKSVKSETIKYLPFQTFRWSCEASPPASSGSSTFAVPRRSAGFPASSGWTTF